MLSQLQESHNTLYYSTTHTIISIRLYSTAYELLNHPPPPRDSSPTMVRHSKHAKIPSTNPATRVFSEPCVAVTITTKSAATFVMAVITSVVVAFIATSPSIGIQTHLKTAAFDSYSSYYFDCYLSEMTLKSLLSHSLVRH